MTEYGGFVAPSVDGKGKEGGSRLSSVFGSSRTRTPRPELFRYAGITGHEYRLVFIFEDRYGPARSTTVWPCGAMENEEDWKPEKGKVSSRLHIPRL